MILKPGELLAPKKLREAVKKADFTAGEVRIKATGEVSPNGNKQTSEIADLVFQLPDSSQIFLLVSASKESAEKHQPSETTDLLHKLREALKAGKRKFIITGQVHEHKEFPIGLTVEEFEVVDEKD